MSTEFLEANVVDPTKPPELPLKREEVGPPIRYIPDETPPAITSRLEIWVAENEKLAHVLKADDGRVKWAITGGADVERFELNKVSGVTTLRWADDGTKDYEEPDDQDGNNFYEVEITTTNPLGYSSTALHGVEVRDKTESVVSPFTDNFNRVNQVLEYDANWLRVDGEFGRLAIAGNRVRVTRVGAHTAYLSPDTGSDSHYAQAFMLSASAARIAVSITDSGNYISVNRNISGTLVQLRKVVDGEETLLETWSAANDATLRLEYADGVATVKRNGETLGTVEISEPPPATSRAGIIAATSSGAIGAFDVMDNFESGALGE